MRFATSFRRFVSCLFAALITGRGCEPRLQALLVIVLWHKSKALLGSYGATLRINEGSLSREQALRVVCGGGAAKLGWYGLIEHHWQSHRWCRARAQLLLAGKLAWTCGFLLKCTMHGVSEAQYFKLKSKMPTHYGLEDQAAVLRHKQSSTHYSP